MAERYLWDDEWTLGISHKPFAQIVRDGGDSSPERLPIPRNVKFLADPFGWESSAGEKLVFEAYDADERRGYIASASISDLNRGKIERVLDSTQHLSYPYIFPHRGRLYCLPESHESGEVPLYEIHPTNDSFAKIASLLRGVPACDPTLFEHEGRLWLFATTSVAGANSRLFGWWADDILGPWTPHTQAPLKTDVASSRPAGRPFLLDGQLIRPAQDCSRTYGGGIVLNRVVELTPTRFREEPLGGVAVPPGWDGLHTLSKLGNLTIIDLKRRRFLPFAPRALLLRYRSALRATLRRALKKMPSGRVG
jgi:hypothetical protein